MVNVQEGGKRDTDDPLSCSHGALQGLAASHGDASGQDALNGGFVQRAVV